MVGAGEERRSALRGQVRVGSMPIGQGRGQIAAGLGYNPVDTREGQQGGGDRFQVAAIGGGAQGGPEIDVEDPAQRAMPRNCRDAHAGPILAPITPPRAGRPGPAGAPGTAPRG